MNYLFACYELGNLDDDVHGFLHVLDRHELIAAVEVQATGKDIGTRQALERELGAVRTSANGFYTRLFACIRRRIFLSRMRKTIPPLQTPANSQQS